jgi:hypothetical protein
MKLRRPWTASDDAALAECMARGMSRATIAIRLKRSQIGIRSRIRALAAAMRERPQTKLARDVREEASPAAD